MGAASLTRVSPALEGVSLARRYSSTSGKKPYLFSSHRGDDGSSDDMCCKPKIDDSRIQVAVHDWIIVNQGKKVWPVFVVMVYFAGMSWEVRKTGTESDSYLRLYGFGDVAPISRLNRCSLRTHADLLVTLLNSQLQDSGKGGVKCEALRFLCAPTSFYEDATEAQYGVPPYMMEQTTSSCSTPLTSSSVSSSTNFNFDLTSNLVSTTGSNPLERGMWKERPEGPPSALFYRRKDITACISRDNEALQDCSYVSHTSNGMNATNRLQGMDPPKYTSAIKPKSSSRKRSVNDVTSIERIHVRTHSL